jgi:hypothetical protein
MFCPFSPRTPLARAGTAGDQAHARHRPIGPDVDAWFRVERPEIFRRWRPLGGRAGSRSGEIYNVESVNLSMGVLDD